MDTTIDTSQLRAEYSRVLAQADALAAPLREGKMLSEDVQASINALLGKSDELKANIEMASRISSARKDADEPMPTAAMTSWRQAGPNEGSAKYDAKSWREMEVMTPVGLQKVRYHVPIGTDQKGYSGAFESYLRQSFNRPMGPTDAKILSEGSDNSGGFFVPEEYIADVLKKTMGMTAVRPNARVIQTGRDLVRYPRLNYQSNATDDASGIVFTSPIRLTWSGEIPATSTSVQVTDPVGGVLQIPVNTALASIPISNDLIEDAAFDIQSFYTDLLGEAFALGEDYAYLNGDGVAKPFGLLTSPGTTDRIPTKAANTGGTLKAVDIINLFYKVPAQYRPMGRWITNSNTMAAIEALVDSQGRYLVSSLLSGANLGAAQFSTLKGAPVAVDEFMPDIAASAYPLVYGDLRGYLILERVGLSVQRAEQPLITQNQVLLVARRRVGGQLVEPYKLAALAC